MIKYLLYSLLALSFFPTKAQLQATKLTCEYLENPLGIDEAKPRLSWNLTSPKRNQTQTAYEVLVSDNPKNIQKGNIWQTGKILSAQNLHIEYNGLPLKPFTKYYWCVKVYDQNGGASAFSQMATFETAMLNPTDWKGQWIGDGSKQFEKDEDFYQNDQMPLFKKEAILTNTSLKTSSRNLSKI